MESTTLNFAPSFTLQVSTFQREREREREKNTYTYTDKTSLKADKEVGGGAGPTPPGGPAGPTPPGGAVGRTTRKPWKTMTNHIRTHQECPELVQEAPQMPHDLAEPLFKPFREQSFAPTPRARPGGLFELQSPSDRITHAGTIEISRSDSPPNLRLDMQRY